MDRLTTIEDLDREIEKIMREQGVSRSDAIVLIGRRQGEVFGDGDLVCVRPLTDDQRRRLGLGRRPEEVLAELGELEDDEVKDDEGPGLRQRPSAAG